MRLIACLIFVLINAHEVDACSRRRTASTVLVAAAPVVEKADNQPKDLNLEMALKALKQRYPKLLEEQIDWMKSEGLYRGGGFRLDLQTKRWSYNLSFGNPPVMSYSEMGIFNQDEAGNWVAVKTDSQRIHVYYGSPGPRFKK